MAWWYTIHTHTLIHTTHQSTSHRTDLLQKVHASNRQMQEEVAVPRRPHRSGRVAADAVNIAVRDSNIDLITLILEAMEREHEFLYHAVLFPVTACVMEALPEASRETRANELYFEDLEKMAPEDVARIAEWLTEKVDAFSSKVKPEAKDVEEEVRWVGGVWCGDACAAPCGDDPHSVMRPTRRWLRV